MTAAMQNLPVKDFPPPAYVGEDREPATDVHPVAHHVVADTDADHVDTDDPADDSDPDDVAARSAEHAARSVDRAPDHHAVTRHRRARPRLTPCEPR